MNGLNSRSRRSLVLYLHSFHIPDSMPTFSPWHDPEKIDSDIFRIDFVLVNIEKSCSLQGPSFWNTKGIERMSVGFVLPIANFYKDNPFSIACNNIYLSSLDLVIASKYRISLFLKILYSRIFSCVSDRSTWRECVYFFRHREVRSDPEKRNHVIVTGLLRKARNDRYGEISKMVYLWE